MPPPESEGAAGESLDALRERLSNAEHRCAHLEARVEVLERERRELRERLEALLGLIEGLDRP